MDELANEDAEKFECQSADCHRSSLYGDIVAAVFAEARVSVASATMELHETGKALGTKHVGKARHCRHHDATGYEPTTYSIQSADRGAAPTNWRGSRGCSLPRALGHVPEAHVRCFPSETVPIPSLVAISVDHGLSQAREPSKVACLIVRYRTDRRSVGIYRKAPSPHRPR
jgi:hypothetical protein